MKNFRILIGAFSLLFVFSAIQAQRSPEADKVIKQSKAKYDGLKDLQADFRYTLSNPNLKKPIVKKGQISLKKTSYRIIFADEEMYCNGKFIWVKLNEDEEIIKSNFEAEGSASPDRLYQIFEQDSKTKYEGQENGAHKVVVFSEDEKSEIWKSEIWINSSSKLIDKAIMFGRNGSQYEYVMSNLKLNEGLSDSVFEVDEDKYAAEDWIITDQTD